MTVAETTRDEILIALANANASAKRMHDSPAYWARIHERINDWLTDLDELR